MEKIVEKFKTSNLELEMEDEDVDNPVFDMIYCSHCGEHVPMGRFCFQCGAKLYINCTSCHSLIHSDSKFCPNCGNQQ